MGKDATNTVSLAENQGLNQSSTAAKGEQFKDAAGFHGDKWQNVKDGEQYKSSDASTVRPMEDPDAGGFHGDKWKNLPSEELSRDSKLTNSMGDEFSTELGSQSQMGAAQKFHGKDEVILRPQASEWAELPPAHTVIRTELPPAPILLDDHFDGVKDSGVHNDVLKNETREAKKEMHAELKSQAGHTSQLLPSELQYEGTTIHDGRSGGMLPDGRTVAPELAKSIDTHDSTMRDATIHDGRTRTIHDAAIVEPNPLDKLSLKDRIIAGVRAGDPLSSATLDTKKKSENSKADQHFKNDNGLIPHEHLKKDESLLADAHIAGDLKKEVSFKKDKKDKKFKKDKKSKKDKHFENDAHLNKDINIVESTHLSKDAQLTKDIHRDVLIKDVHSTHLNNQDATFMAEDRLSKDSKDTHLEGSDKKGGKLKDKAKAKKDKLKEKLGMKKDEELKSAEAPQAPTDSTKGHEIATIKIPGIESGDRAAQEMVNHQAKAKKELNAELKEHAGHSDHIAPSEILGLGHGMGQMSLHENRAVDSQISMPSQGTDAMADQITRDQVLAKSELNAEIKNHAGEQIIPSGLQSNLLHKDIQSEGQDQFLSKDFQKNQFDTNDAFKKEDMLAKKELNAEIQEHATMGSENILPSEILGKDQLQSKDLKSKDLQSEDLLSKNQLQSELSNEFSKDQVLAKKDLNAEIQDVAGLNASAIMPSEISHKHGSELQSSDKTDLSGSNDSSLRAAKKELNAEIKEHAGMGSDNILPSEIHGKDFQSEHDSEKTDFHKDKFLSKDSKKEHFENTDKFQNSQFSSKEYLDDRPGGLGAIFKDGVMHDHVMAVQDLNAEIKEAASMAQDDQLLPSELSGGSAIAPGGVTVIHDGRSDIQGSDRLKGEMEYEQAEGEATASTEGLSMREKLMGAVTTVTNAAVAVKDSLQGTLQGTLQGLH